MATESAATDLITLPAYAAAAGVTRQTAWLWFREGLIPGARQIAPGRTVRVPRSALDALVVTTA